MPVAISGYDLPVDMHFRTGFWDQGRAMACLSWAIKSIKGLEAYQLTHQDDLYYDHGLLMHQCIESRQLMHMGPEQREQLKTAVIEVFRDHGFKGTELKDIFKRNLVGRTQQLSLTAGSAPQSVYRKRGDDPPAVEYGILPTPLMRFIDEPMPIFNSIPCLLYTSDAADDP